MDPATAINKSPPITVHPPNVHERCLQEIEYWHNKYLQMKQILADVFKEGQNNLSLMVSLSESTRTILELTAIGAQNNEEMVHQSPRSSRSNGPGVPPSRSRVPRNLIIPLERINMEELRKKLESTDDESLSATKLDLSSQRRLSTIVEEEEGGASHSVTPVVVLKEPYVRLTRISVENLSLIANGSFADRVNQISMMHGLGLTPTPKQSPVPMDESSPPLQTVTRRRRNIILSKSNDNSVLNNSSSHSGRLLNKLKECQTSTPNTENPDATQVLPSCRLKSFNNSTAYALDKSGKTPNNNSNLNESSITNTLKNNKAQVGSSRREKSKISDLEQESSSNNINCKRRRVAAENNVGCRKTLPNNKKRATSAESQETKFAFTMKVNEQLLNGALRNDDALEREQSRSNASSLGEPPDESGAKNNGDDGAESNLENTNVGAMLGQEKTPALTEEEQGSQINDRRLETEEIPEIVGSERTSTVTRVLHNLINQNEIEITTCQVSSTSQQQQQQQNTAANQHSNKENEKTDSTRNGNVISLNDNRPVVASTRNNLAGIVSLMAEKESSKIPTRTDGALVNHAKEELWSEAMSLSHPSQQQSGKNLQAKNQNQKKAASKKSAQSDDKKKPTKKTKLAKRTKSIAATPEEIVIKTERVTPKIIIKQEKTTPKRTRDIERENSGTPKDQTAKNSIDGGSRPTRSTRPKALKEASLRTKMRR